MFPTDSQRPDPDALLARVQAQERKAARGKLRIYFGASAGVGKTFGMLAAARTLHAEGQQLLVGVIETHGRSETAALLEGLDVLPLEGGRLPRQVDHGIRPRCRAGAPSAPDPGGRTGPFERVRLAPSEALAGRRGTARRRHRRIYHRERAAPGKPERRRRRHYRHPRRRDGARYGVRRRRRGRAGRYSRRRTAGPAQERQGVPGAAGRTRVEEFFPQGQPDRPARTGLAPHRRPHRGRRARLSRRAVDRHHLEDRRRAAGLRRPAARLRPCGAQHGPPGRPAGHQLARHLRRDARAAAPAGRAARTDPGHPETGPGPGRDHRRVVGQRHRAGQRGICAQP